MRSKKRRRMRGFDHSPKHNGHQSYSLSYSGLSQKRLGSERLAHIHVNRVTRTMARVTLLLIQDYTMSGSQSFVKKSIGKKSIIRTSIGRTSERRTTGNRQGVETYWFRR